MNRCRWILLLIVATAFQGCESALPTRSPGEQAVDQAVVALAVAHARSPVASTQVKADVSAEPTPKISRRLVTAYLQPGNGCLPCRRFEQWWHNLTPAQRDELPVTFRIERNSIPVWVQEFPTFHWADPAGRSWTASGWSDIETFLEYDRTGPSASRHPNVMAPSGANRTLNAADWQSLVSGTLQSGEIPFNSQYSLWIPPAEKLQITRNLQTGTVTFEAPFPLLRLNWHGVRYDDSVRKLTITPGKISVTLGTFGEIAFEVDS